MVKAVDSERKSALFRTDILKWLKVITKREGFNSFSQSLMWVLHKAMESDRNARP